MKLLATFKAQDVEINPPDFDYESFKPRNACRGIVFDGDKVALIYIGEHDYYMLPGGGLEADEDLIDGLRREIAEELGATITIMGEVGSATVYFDRWKRRQTDYCFQAKLDKGNLGTARTDFEIEEGHGIVWVSSLEQAVKMVGDAKPLNRDGKLVRARDLLFLKTVLRKVLL